MADTVRYSYRDRLPPNMPAITPPVIGETIYVWNRETGFGFAAVVIAVYANSFIGLEPDDLSVPCEICKRVPHVTYSNQAGTVEKYPLAWSFMDLGNMSSE